MTFSLNAPTCRTDKAFRDAQHWFSVTVDEFQDLNRVQFELLKTWLGDRQDLSVVGDPDQAIYGWNGADFSLLTEFQTILRPPRPALTTIEVNRELSMPQTLFYMKLRLRMATLSPKVNFQHKVVLRMRLRKRLASLDTSENSDRQKRGGQIMLFSPARTINYS